MSAPAAFHYLRELGLEAVLRAALEKIRRDDGLTGKIKIPLSRNQRHELEGLVRLPQTTSPLVPVDLVKLDTALQASRFQVGLIAVLEAGYGPLVTRRQEQELAAARWQTWLEDRLPSGTTAGWLAGIAEGDSPSARWVRRHYADDPARTAQVVDAVVQALSLLPADRDAHMHLAVFAAQVTGDPHAFDAGEPGGRLLLHALAERFPPPPEATDREARTYLLDMAGLGIDQVSSTVLVSGLGTARVGEREHPVVAAMGAYGGAWRITLGEVSRWSAAAGRSHRAYVVENPPVFEYLLEGTSNRPPERRPTLICTEGFFSAAAVRLLNLLAESGSEIWYSGDFDANGLAILKWVLQRYPGVSRPWRMDSESERLALGPSGDGVAYQERLVEQLLADV